jgi:transcriptional regulator with XRE-family HTH domain
MAGKDRNNHVDRSSHKRCDKNIDTSPGIDRAIGDTLRSLRETANLSARQLASESGVSAAMISRIESAQVSPSINTMTALCETLDVPVISLFRDTATEHADYTLVKKGEGLKSTRIVGDHRHNFTSLTHHRRRDLNFEAHLITLMRDQTSFPVYIGHGVLFIHVLTGKAIYAYGKEKLQLSAGDSLSIDAELAHGCERVLSEKFVFLNVQAESR